MNCVVISSAHGELAEHCSSSTSRYLARLDNPSIRNVAWFYDELAFLAVYSCLVEGHSWSGCTSGLCAAHQFLFDFIEVRSKSHCVDTDFNGRP